MKVLLISLKYQLLTSLRVKQSVFFTIVFPVFLFLVFSFIWGVDNSDYSKFLLTGICVMTIASDGIFAISTTINYYFQSGIIKLLKTTPLPIFIYIASLIIARIVILSISFLLLCICASLFFDVSLSLIEVRDIWVSLFLGLVLFSLIGFCIGALNPKGGDNKGLANIVYFALIFFNNLFYPLTDINPALEKFVHYSPLTPVVELARGNYSNIGLLLFWILVFVISYFFILKFKPIKRSQSMI